MNDADLTLRTAYWDDPVAKAAFRNVMREMFRIDFSAWDDAGFWDPAYRPFTLFDAAGRVAANACLYTMNLVVDGRSVKAGQLSGVLTRPEFRRRGLACNLVEAAVQWAQTSGHEFFFLFAEDDALPFYSSIGFTPTDEALTRLHPRPTPPRAGARRLNLSRAADLAMMQRLATSRAPVSHRLGVLNDRLLLFHALIPRREDVWFIEPLNVVVFASRRAGRLTLHDVIGPRVPALAEVYPYLADAGDTEIVLRFETDLMGDLAALGRVDIQPFADNHLHLLWRPPWDPPRLFPATAQA